MVSATMNWAGGLRFEGASAFGHRIVTDAAKNVGGSESGYKPSELLLFGVAGCTGIDVVRILEKQHQEITALEIQVVGHQNEEYPKPFHTVEIKYIARGRNLDRSKVAQAIALSEGKYCIVSQTIRNETKVTTSLEILPE